MKYKMWLTNYKRWIGPLVVVALVAAGAVWMFSGSSGKTVTALFPRTVSLYKGSDVRVRGVQVGSVQSVSPQGTLVKVVMQYEDKVHVPADAKAVIVAPSVVGDRYVQLSWPTGDTQPAMADNATIDANHTSVPLELDQIYKNLDELLKALGPKGANKNGAVSDLLRQVAANFKGQGTQFHQTIGDLGTFTRTLDNNKDQFFGSAKKLEGFVHALSTNDATVRQFTIDMQNISSLLSGERGDFASALKNLATALGSVKTFVATNKQALGTTVNDLNRIFGVIVKQRASFDEILHVAPLALNNLGLVYDPDIGGLNANAHLTDTLTNGLSDPKNFLCALVSSNDPTGSLCKSIAGLPLPRAPFSQSRVGDGQPDLTLGGLVEVGQ